MEENGVGGAKEQTQTDGRHQEGVPLLSVRWRVTLLLFCVNILLYMHRVNLSLAVVCMTKDPTDVYVIDLNTTTPTTFNVTSTYHGFVTDVYIGPNDYITNAAANTGRTVYNVTVAGDTIGYVDGAGTYHVIPGANKNVTVAYESGKTLVTHGQCATNVIGGNSDKGYEAELSWEKTEVSFLLSAYFYGSFFSQVPGGRFADRFGGKHVITVTMVMTAACSLLTPVFARTSIGLVFLLRILIGLAGGAVIPAGITMMSAWAPPKERSVMIAFSCSGFSVGTIISYLTSGLLCVYGFDNGWPSIFYLQGALSLVITGLWCLDVASTPTTHPRISQAELQYIQSSIKHAAKKSSKSIPWRGILCSRPMWGITIAHFCYNWSFFTVLITVPLFLKEVLKFDVKQNGLFSSLPYVCNMTFVLVSGKLSEVIISRRWLLHLLTRRIFTLVSMLGFGACLIFAGHLTCELRHISVLLLCLSCVFAGLVYGGFIINHVEFAGQYTGTVYGITNAGGVISALLSSLLAGLLTPNGTQAEWQVVFYLAAGIDLLGALAFCIFSSVTLEPWARKGLEIAVSCDGSQQELEKLAPAQRGLEITASCDGSQPELEKLDPALKGLEITVPNHDGSQQELEKLDPGGREEGTVT